LILGSSITNKNTDKESSTISKREPDSLGTNSFKNRSLHRDFLRRRRRSIDGVCLMLNKFKNSSAVRLAPLLMLYVLVVCVFSHDYLQGDEYRYVNYATNLSQGYYSPRDDVSLRNGPGYPFILLPIVIFKLPWFTAKMMNSLFLFLAVLYFCKSLCLYIDKKKALCFSYSLGIYLPFFRHLPMLNTETFAIFLVCGFMYNFCKLQIDTEKKIHHALLTSMFLGYLSLTKVFFGYVIAVGFFAFLILSFCLKRKYIYYDLLIYILGLVVCLPYLFYTYSLTGKVFYWGNAGGEVLYWMSTPFENEYGDWITSERVFEDPQLYEKHGEFYNKISGLSRIQMDEAFNKQGLENILRNPIKYIKNWMANIGRLFFSYPFSYTNQKLSTYFYIIPNMFIVVLSILCIYPTYIQRKIIPHEILVLLLFGMVAFGGSSLVSAEERQFSVLVPVFLFWILFTLTCILKIEIRKT
jgi:hypothetical protein